MGRHDKGRNTKWQVGRSFPYKFNDASQSNVARGGHSNDSNGLHHQNDSLTDPYFFDESHLDLAELAVEVCEDYDPYDGIEVVGV
jgi:hypothetical protein